MRIIDELPVLVLAVDLDIVQGRERETCHHPLQLGFVFAVCSGYFGLVASVVGRAVTTNVTMTPNCAAREAGETHSREAMDPARRIALRAALRDRKFKASGEQIRMLELALMHYNMNQRR